MSTCTREFDKIISIMPITQNNCSIMPTSPRVTCQPMQKYRTMNGTPTARLMEMRASIISEIFGDLLFAWRPFKNTSCHGRNNVSQTSLEQLPTYSEHMEWNRFIAVYFERYLSGISTRENDNNAGKTRGTLRPGIGSDGRVEWGKNQALERQR